MHQLLIGYIKTFFELFNEMALYLMIGFFFAGFLHVFIRKERIARYMGGNDTKSAVNASLLGVPLPLCSCGVIPAGLSFMKNGASKGATVSFLISTPQTGVDSIMVTYSMLGWPLAIIRPLVAFITGIVGGLVTNSLQKKHQEAHVTLTDDELPKSFLGKIRELLRYGFVDFLQDISKWLLIGLAIAALLTFIIPDNFFTTYIAYKWLNMVLVLAVSVPLYVCATGSVPIAAVLMMKGLSPGAALVFLMAGPATNITTISVLSKSLGKGAMLAYLLTITGGAFVAGAIIDTFLPAEWFTGFMDHSSHNHMETSWLQITASVILGLLLVNGVVLKWIANRKEKNRELNTQNMAIKTFLVEGMTCNNCKAHVEKGIKALTGIEDVIADPVSGKVSVSGSEIDADKVAQSVEAAGYSFKGEV
jgi:uncharacterized protein